MARLEQLHQRKRDDETDRGPFQASQKHVKHSAPILAQAPAALNWRKSAIRTGSSSGELSESSVRASAEASRSLAFLGAKAAVLLFFRAKNRLCWEMR